MAVRQVLRIGHPILLEKALAVTDFNSPALDALINDMFDTMSACRGVGLAAPQIGVSQRIVIFEVTGDPRIQEDNDIPRTVLINPEIEVIGDEMISTWEGCLSVPGMRGRVARHQHIRYRGFDARGRAFEREVRGFHAIVVQHECDHLDGILYPRRISDLREFGYEDELLDHQAEEKGE